MNNNEINELQSQTDIDLKAIEKNPNYLLKKFNQLSQRGKESLIDYLNINLKLACKCNNKNTQNANDEDIKLSIDSKIIPFPVKARGCELG